MKALLKQLYDYQWELTLAGAQIEENILRSHCNAENETAVRGLSRSLIITASNIKYDLLSLEQKLTGNQQLPLNDDTNAAHIKDALHKMEHILFNEIKAYVGLMAHLNEQLSECEAADVLKKDWPKIAEIYQFFKASLLKWEQENCL